MIADEEGKGPRLRRPVFSVFLNKNNILTGVESFEVTNASHFEADTFTISCAIGGLPAGFGEAYWAQSIGDELQIYAGFRSAAAPGAPGEGSPVQLIYGEVDDVNYDPARRTIKLSGRDLSARFIDARTAEDFQNQTASQVVQTLAARHGLKASVTPTTTLVGTYYEICNLKLTKEQSEWDLLKILAEFENYDLWVSGETLNFQPPVPLTTDPYVLTWSDLGQGQRNANFESLLLQRSQTLARDVLVKVVSWNQEQEANITATATRSAITSTQQKGARQQLYTFYTPNLNKVQANQLATAKAEEITRHERVIAGRLPGDTLLTNRSLIKLQGTNTAWDQLYFVDSVTRRMSVAEGYTMEFRAKNHSPQNQTLV